MKINTAMIHKNEIKMTIRRPYAIIYLYLVYRKTIYVCPYFNLSAASFQIRISSPLPPCLTGYPLIVKVRRW